MSDKTSQIERQHKLILDSKKKGRASVLFAYCKLSGPGWMQSATTLGGGSLASALYLGVLGGVGFMWLQPLAMMLGIVMLAAISYVTLSISDKPMLAVNRHISPILGYGWAMGSLLACMVFAMPQFSLAVASIEQNLMAETFSKFSSPVLGKTLITAFFFLLSISMIVLYASGGKNAKIFDIFIKGSVALIVICFFGVVIRLAWGGMINWSAVWSGFIPNFSVFSEPSADFMEHISKLGDAGAKFWSDMIVSQQRDVVISAAAMAVGINMTFLFPYSMLKKGWNKDFRGLAIFDLSTGLFIPFLLATSCIVVASASQFHAKAAAGLVDSEWSLVKGFSEKGDLNAVLRYGKDGHLSDFNASEISDDSKIVCIKNASGALPSKNLIKPYMQLLESRVKNDLGAEKFASYSADEKFIACQALDTREKTLAAMLVKRDASNLSDTLAPLVGEDVARYIFGFGVLGMAMNAILMNMLICGLCFSEILGKSGSAKWQLAGSMLITFSAVASLFWEGAKMWLVIHAGVIAMVLLPIAYGAFLLIMNSEKIMGSSMPRGKSRVVWNVLMSCSLAASSLASMWVLWNKLGILGIAIFFAFLFAVVASNRLLKRKVAR